MSSRDVLGEEPWDTGTRCLQRMAACARRRFQNGDIGHARSSWDALRRFQNHLSSTSPAFHALHRKLAREQIDHQPTPGELSTMMQMVDEGVSILTGTAIWRASAACYGPGCSNGGGLAHHDAGYRRCLCGGGKTSALGENSWVAGGGGFHCSSPGRRIMSEFVWRFPDCCEVPFKFEGLGTQIVFYQEDQLMLDDVWAQSSAQTAARLSHPHRKGGLMARFADCDVIPFSAGGFGTRLQSVVSDRPKPMAEIHGRPFVSLLVEHFLRHGARRFIFSTGHFVRRDDRGLVPAPPRGP